MEIYVNVLNQRSQAYDFGCKQKTEMVLFFKMNSASRNFSNEWIRNANVQNLFVEFYLQN